MSDSTSTRTASSLLASQYTSEIGSYSCTSHLERIRRASLKETYPDRLLVMRHSERVDDLFPGWIQRFRNVDYRPYDANMPLHLPVERPITDFQEDSPITVCGQVLAGLAGRAIGSQNLRPDVIYCSPAIRCIQTARAVREASGSKALLRIEPGLFENTSLYPTITPCFASWEQLREYPIDRKYRSIYTTAGLFTTPETNVDYNNRVYSILRKISLSTELLAVGSTELNVLCVAHASSVDMAVGLLRADRRNSTAQDLFQIGTRIPYCSTVVMEREDGHRGWQPNRHALPFISYAGFSNVPLPSFVYRV